MPVTSSPYGTPGSDTRSYSIADVGASQTIDNAKWTELYNNVNTERSRRGYGAIGNPGFTGIIQASDLNALRDGINSAGYTGGFGGVSVGNIVRATDINSMIDKIQAAGAVCVCNCNYCTCNCNYCTCNCNYACTCNCNYSDERLKTNIKFIGMQAGLRLYTWNYRWDLKTSHKGVIAQELIGTRYENALSKDSKGFYMVDYSKLPIKI
jgi:hypothetical protein